MGDIIFDVSGAVATITLNRPDVMNALLPEMVSDLHERLDECDANADIRAIILTGSGRAFCTGFHHGPRPDGSKSRLDPSDAALADYLKRWADLNDAGQERLMHLWNLGTPVIAAVNGWAMGAGFWYQLASDITIAAESAVFAQPAVRETSNSTILFAALSGWKAAHRYTLTGDHLDANEALRIGLVNEVVPDSRLLTRARELAERIAKVPEPSVRLNKAITSAGLLAMGLGNAMLSNAALSVLAHCSHNAQREELFATMRSEGLRAFIQKRDGPFQPEPFGPRSKAS